MRGSDADHAPCAPLDGRVLLQCMDCSWCVISGLGDNGC